MGKVTNIDHSIYAVEQSIPITMLLILCLCLSCALLYNLTQDLHVEYTLESSPSLLLETTLNKVPKRHFEWFIPQVDGDSSSNLYTGICYCICMTRSQAMEGKVEEDCYIFLHISGTSGT